MRIAMAKVLLAFWVLAMPIQLDAQTISEADDQVVGFEQFMKSISGQNDTLQVIYIYNSFCQGCIASFPKLAQMRMEKRDCPVNFWMVSTDQAEATWRRLLSRTTTGWSHVRVAPDDRDAFVENIYHETVVPTIYVWRGGKKIKHPDSANKLESYLDGACSR